jgi:ABC-2 type transport system ATP-binding protein
MASQLDCRITMVQPEDAFIRTLSDWNFRSTDPGLTIWEGKIAGPDRLRFLGMLSRYAALLSGVEMNETQVVDSRENVA